MTTMLATAPATAACPPALQRLKRALLKKNNLDSIDIIEKTLKADKTAYTTIVDMCDHFDAKADVRLHCHKTYYKLAGTPYEKAVGAINAARVHYALSGPSLKQFLSYGPFVIFKVRRTEVAAIKWLRRAQKTGLSGDDQQLVRLLMRRSSKHFVSSKSAIRDHLEALHVTAYALQRGHFYGGHLAAIEKPSSSDEVSSFIKHTIRPLIERYQPAPDSQRCDKAWQLSSLARARKILQHT